MLDNDFTSLDLGPARRHRFGVERSVRWSQPLYRNSAFVTRPAEPGEVQYGPYVIRNPLKINGVIHPLPACNVVNWDRMGNFLGFSAATPFSSFEKSIVIDYMEKHMGLFNFSWEDCYA